MRSRALAMRWRWTLHRMDARDVRGCWARGRTRTGRGSMRWIPGRRGSHPRASGPGLPQAGPYRFNTECNNSSSRAGLGETGDALVVSRGSTAGASPRRRPELIPRSRATLLKAARGGSARAPQSASGPFKISIGPADGSVSIFGYERQRRDSRRTTRRTGRSGFVGAMSGLLSLIRRCASSIYPGPTHRHPTHGTAHELPWSSDDKT